MEEILENEGYGDAMTSMRAGHLLVRASDATASDLVELSRLDPIALRAEVELTSDVMMMAAAGAYQGTITLRPHETDRPLIAWLLVHADHLRTRGFVVEQTDDRQGVTVTLDASVETSD